MKTLSTFLLLLFASTTLFAAIPTPQSALAFDTRKDPRKWVPQHQDANKNGFIMELVPQGDSIKAWKEMAEHQVIFTDLPLRTFIDSWRKMLQKADPNVKMEEEKLKDGSILVTYTSEKANETAFRRFIKGKDGIYMLAYHVRPKLKNEDTYKIWSEIIRSSYLVANPERKR